MPLSRPKIPYGASYSPLTFDESCWEKDLDWMSRAGMNIVRVGDIGTWEIIESHEGLVSLDGLQRFYSLANRFNIHIMLSTGSATPPLWLYHKHPDVRIRSNRGEDYPLGASYHWACIHHPGYREACERYIEKLAEFAMQQPNHFGWQISNEIGFPFNPTRESNDVDLYCYCSHSRQAFINWLKTKYGSLDKLNQAWSWSTTNFRYNSWEEAFPPEALPKSWSSVTRWMDWRLFWQEAYAVHARWEHEVIRRIDPDHPTSVNTFNFKGFDRFGTYTGLDQWLLSKNVDHIGYDLYPGSGNKVSERPEHTSIFLDHGRSVSQFAGSEFWLHEVESGPIGGWLLGPDRSTDEKDVLAMCFESLGHNGKLMIYMPWREWRFQPIHWGALVDLHGNPTPRYHTASMVGEYIRKNESFLKNAHVPRGEVAILESKRNAIFMRGVGQEEELFDAQRGAYTAFWEQDYSVDFITPEQCNPQSLKPYRFICLPLMGVMNQETAKALLEYVRSGGVLVAFARLGTLTDEGWYQADLPLPDLAQVFGVNSIEAEPLKNQKLSFKNNWYEGWLNRDVLSLATNTEVLGRFEDGNPAVTINKVGRGYGIYIATQADGSLVRTGSPLLKDVIHYTAERMGIKPRTLIGFAGREKREIDHHILDTSNRTEIIIVSSLDRSVQVDIRQKESGRLVENVTCGLLEKMPLAFSMDKDEILLTLEMEPREVKCIQVTWKNALRETKEGKEVN